MKKTTWILFAILLVLVWTSILQAKPEVTPVDAGKIPQIPSQGGSKDEIYIYGGPGTLEGKFETEGGDPDRQGWTSHDLTGAGFIPDEFQIDTFNCQNLDPGTPDNHAYWCGDYYFVAGCDDPVPGGYGPFIDAGLEWEIFVDDPQAVTEGTLEFSLNYDLEPAYDNLFVEFYSEVSGSWIILNTYTGQGYYGFPESIFFSINPDDYAGDEKVRLRFRVESDGAWDSHDCQGGYYDGACQIDNILVSFDLGSGLVAQGPVETCEPGDPQNWVGVNYFIPPPPVGDFAKVWPLLEESVPGALNTTPRWAFIDDGEVVPELPGYTLGFDYGPGGFCVNADGGLAGPGTPINNVVRSPIIPFPAGVWTEAYFEFERYLHQAPDAEGFPVFPFWAVRSTADPTGNTGWTGWQNDNLLYYGGPFVAPMQMEILSYLVEDCRALQVSFGVVQENAWPMTTASSPAPYYDNAAVRLVGTPFAQPTIIAEPEFTAGLNNAIAWNDESASGAANYWIECATDEEFNFQMANSGWIPGLSHEFTGLEDGHTYFYRVKYTNLVLSESAWSTGATSTQDANPPVSSADAQPAAQSTLAFNVPYTATDATSGVVSVELFFAVDGGGFTSFGSFTASPIPFIAAGEGQYTFYTVATDGVGYVEAVPAGYDAITQVTLAANNPEVVILPAASGPYNCSDTVLLTFRYVADAGTPDLFLYNAIVRCSSELAFGAITSLEPFGGGSTDNFFTVDNGDGTWTITGSTVASPSQPVVAPADVGLFTVAFGVVAEGTGAVTFDQVILRDPGNNTFDVDVSGAIITSDCTPPNAVTSLAAAAAHNKVQVSWQHDLLDVGHYAVFRGLWYDTSPGNSAYPEYDDQPGETIPIRPVDYAAAVGSAEWELAGSVPAGTLSFTDSGMTTGRGVYYYEVFAVDLVLNGSASALENDRTTNYWLGDVNPVDGVVDVGDITLFGANFGTTVPLDDPANVVDVGPTDDWSATGIPLTDSIIDFEDLMMFSINFGVVTPAKTDPQISDTVVLAWVTLDDGRQALRLEEGHGVKGLRVRSLEPVSVISVEAGRLLDEQPEVTFLQNISTSLDLSVAVMGRDVGFAGKGDLFILQTDIPLELISLNITARAVDNSVLEVSLSSASAAPIPRVYALHANYPNPFNPMTIISFALPENQHVRLSIYGLDGREVCSLVNENREAGMHEVVWAGQDNRGRTMASGTYFYRLEAGSFQKVMKMTLMK